MDTESRLMATMAEAGAGREGEMGIQDWKPNFGGEHIVGHSEVEIQCCLHETYNIIN